MHRDQVVRGGNPPGTALPSHCSYGIDAMLTDRDPRAAILSSVFISDAFERRLPCSMTA